jgi:hypothetical protein
MLDYPRLVELLDARDIKVSAAGDKLRVDAPKGAVTASIAEAIRAHKTRLALRDGTSYTVRTKDKTGKVTTREVHHVWCPCDLCGQAVLLDPVPRHARKLVWPRCYLTPGCGGRHHEAN